MKYFITYVYNKNGGFGFGSSIATVKNGKMNEDTINEYIADVQTKLKVKNVVIINWNKLDD
jgi:hypothetical protein